MERQPKHDHGQHHAVQPDQNQVPEKHRCFQSPQCQHEYKPGQQQEQSQCQKQILRRHLADQEPQRSNAAQHDLVEITPDSRPHKDCAEPHRNQHGGERRRATHQNQPEQLSEFDVLRQRPEVAVIRIHHQRQDHDQNGGIQHERSRPDREA